MSTTQTPATNTKLQVTETEFDLLDDLAYAVKEVLSVSDSLRAQLADVELQLTGGYGRVADIVHGNGLQKLGVATGKVDALFEFANKQFGRTHGERGGSVVLAVRQGGRPRSQVEVV